MKNKITIGLLSHFFQDTNLGCTALSICNIVMIDDAAKKLGLDVKYIVMVNEKQPHIDLDFTSSEYEYRVYTSTKQTLKHPFKVLKTTIFDDCDVVFNLCAGDGFTDIYGKWRTFSESYMTIIGAKKGCRMILAPQTIGPFNDFFCRKLAKYMMNQCEKIFVRDHMSYQLCCDMGQKEKTTEVVDVALALPFEKVSFDNDEFNIGINVSGLLYNEETNIFNLSLDYKELVHSMVDYSIKKGFKVHLISHVIIPEEKGEDDFNACKKVHELFPSTILAPVYDSPIEIKGYIAGLDMFVGARMHATIAAISSGVPVIPIAYSRKVNGLYGNLEYPYYIDAKNSMLSNGQAMETFVKYLEQIDVISESVKNSSKICKEYLSIYSRKVEDILESVN